MNKTIIKIYLFNILILIFLWDCAHLPSSGIGDLLRAKERALETGIDDAKTDIPFLDDFNPTNFGYMTILPRTLSGSYLLQPGLFQMHCESYCLKAGTYGPATGDGYIYAPLKGPRAKIIKKILRESVNHPDIKQRDIQVLIWAIIARSKVEDISSNARKAAIKLLTPTEIIEINGGAISIIPDDLLKKFLSGLPTPLQSLLETEAKIREMLSKRDATYEEIEKVAVLFGEPSDAEPARNIPEGRWSLHPEGYFVRFFPSGYTRTLLQIYVPETFNLERDKYNRITKIEDEWGNAIETEYQDSIIPKYVTGRKNLNAYTFKTIKFRKKIFGTLSYMDSVNLELLNTGWTLQGNPSGKISSKINTSRFSDLENRQQWGIEHKKHLENLDKEFKGKGAISELTDLAMFYQGIKKTVDERELLEENPWASKHCMLIQKAWQYLLCKTETGIIRDNSVLAELYSELESISENNSSISIKPSPTKKSNNGSDKKNGKEKGKKDKNDKKGKDDKSGSDSPGSAPAKSQKQLNGNSNRPVPCSELQDAIDKLKIEIRWQELFIETVEENPGAIGLYDNGKAWRDFIEALRNLSAIRKGVTPPSSKPYDFITAPNGEIRFIYTYEGETITILLRNKNGKDIPDNIELAKRFFRDAIGNNYLADILFDILFNIHEKSHAEDYASGNQKDSPSSAAESEMKAFKKSIEAKKKALKNMEDRLKNEDCTK